MQVQLLFENYTIFELHCITVKECRNSKPSSKLIALFENKLRVQIYVRNDGKFSKI